MQLIAKHPIDEQIVLPHCGKQVIAVTKMGDTIMGVLDRVENGCIILKPFGHEPSKAEISQMNSVSRKKKGKKLIFRKNKQTKASTKAIYGGLGNAGFGGYPYPYYNPRVGIILPLFILATLFAFPFI